jgi:hypothetical protein
MEQANTPHPPDPPAGSVTQDAAHPSRPDNPVVPEDTGTTTPPTEPDSDFEPV